MYNGNGTSDADARRKVTVPSIRARKTVGPHADPRTPQTARISMVTAYDYTMARLVDAAGVDMVLVGDSLGMVVQGLANTIPVTLDEICYHGRAVARGVQRAHLVGDLPFMSYQVSSAQAVESAGKIMKDGAFESVKLEGGLELADHVFRIVRAGIPVVGHIGLTPQSVHVLGGFKVQGRGDEAAEKLVADARALEQAGCFAIVLEAIPPDLAARVSAELAIPTIGIGAGAACDGQVLVCTDLLGMVRGKIPKFAKRYAELGDAIVEAMEAYVREVQDGSFPALEHTYKPNGISASVPPPPLDGGADLDEPLALDLWH